VLAVPLAFTVGLIASLILTLPVRQLALRVDMVDHPGPRKVHLTPVPLLGGLAIYCGVVFAVLVSLSGTARTQALGILIAATLVVLVGILDDRGLLHHQIKLFVGMPAAALIVMATGIRAQVFSAILPGRVGLLADAGLTIFWIVGITAAFSILDHMDGLCAGVAGTASMFFTIFASWSAQVLVATLAAAVLGAAIGFLRWNFNPAQIFMGDGGAMFLGFLMATLALKLRLTDLPYAIAWMIPVLILGVPIFDTVLVSISRARRGLLPFAAPGKDHTAHRLANLGLGQRGAVIALCGLGNVFGLLAMLVRRLSVRESYEVAGLIVLASLVAISSLERAPYDRQEVRQRSG
jgi:UDP-GlcNAc:undecaprenyl-phosphate/decaprenyl-phosphate GlcNAc-1-phosphate transferase